MEKSQLGAKTHPKHFLLEGFKYRNDLKYFKEFSGNFKPFPMVNFEFKLPFEQNESSSNSSAVTSLLSKNTSTPTQQTTHSVSEQRSASL